MIFDYLSVSTDAYWSSHYALGKYKSGQNSKVFFGSARIVELLMNTILPLFAAKARLSCSDGFYTYLMSVLLKLPHVLTYQRIHRSIPFSNDCINIWPSQAVYQALLHLETKYCRQNLCYNCPVLRIPG